MEVQNNTQKETENSSSETELKALEESNKKSTDVSTEEITEPKKKIMKKRDETSKINAIVDGGHSSGSGAWEPMEQDQEGDLNEKSKEKNAEDTEEALKRKKRNVKRSQHRALKAEKDKIKSYEDEVDNDDYCTWVPPEGQSGDGKTSLNEKFGY